MAARFAWPLLALAFATQQAPPQFRAGVDSVAIYATVFNRAHQVVRDLRRDDFQVFDDGRRQELTVFENTIQPIAAVLLVDHSASMTLGLDLARTAAEQFVIRMSPGDRIRVGGFADGLRLSTDFTDDRDRLLRELRELRLGTFTRLWDAIDDTMTALAGLGGRRVIVLLTDGEDTYSSVPPRDLVERAKAEGIMVYAIQLRTSSPPGLERLIVSPGRPVISNAPRVRIQPAQVLRDLAQATGGAHFSLSPQDDVNATFTQVAFELHCQYVLGFTPSRLDGKLHTLEVRARDPRWTVRARRHYLAPTAQGQ